MKNVIFGLIILILCVACTKSTGSSSGSAQEQEPPSDRACAKIDSGSLEKAATSGFRAATYCQISEQDFLTLNKTE